MPKTLRHLRYSEYLLFLVGALHLNLPQIMYTNLLPEYLPMSQENKPNSDPLKHSICIAILGYLTDKKH